VVTSALDERRDGVALASAYLRQHVRDEEQSYSEKGS
jgi:hypothetical protein